jgi:hypothetical protein
MCIFFRTPFLFSGMAGETEVLGFCGWKTDSPGFDVLLVASQALLVDRGAVFPGSFADDVLMTTGAGYVLFKTHLFYGGGPLQVMAAGTALGQPIFFVEQIDILAKGTGVEVRLQLAKPELDCRASGKDAKSVHPRFQRDPEVQVIMIQTFFNHNRIKNGT